MKKLALALAFAGAVSMSACQTSQQTTGTLAGGAIGAGSGALIGDPRFRAGAPAALSRAV